MSSPSDLPSLERPDFFDGQRLTAADLATTQDYLRELRWLHNRSLHSWGIVVGFALAGGRGDRTVAVQPGYALDCLGRDLILSTAQSVDLPAVAGAADGGPITYHLTLSYAPDDELAPSETRDGVCQGKGAVRLPEAPRLRWQDPTDAAPESRYRRGLDVIVATAKIQNCRLAAPLSIVERRSARQIQKPHVSAGATPLGGTSWQFWTEGGETAGVETDVDTSAAGFGSTPSYTARVAGGRLLRDPLHLGGTFYPGQMVDGFVRIQKAGPTGFLLQLLMPRDLKMGQYELNPATVLGDQQTLDDLQTKLQWQVIWMGVEG